MPDETPCVWPTGKHFWSIPEPSGRQTCLWCPAVKWPETVEPDEQKDTPADGRS